MEVFEMKILFVASEVAPFSKTGGLADVAGSLPKALVGKGLDCRVVTPLYGPTADPKFGSVSIDEAKLKFIKYIYVPVSWRNEYCGIYEAEHNGVTHYFFDNKRYFFRDTLYNEYENAERFAFFSRAVLEIIPHIGFVPDIIHCNDWQTALTPLYLSLFYDKMGPYQNIKTVFTIHNIEYQGPFDLFILGDVFGIDQGHEGAVRHKDQINLMKGGINAADRVTTVSQTYSREILTPKYSHGLDPVLNEQAQKLSGIINGIDWDANDPATDNAIFRSFSSDDISGKAENKRGLQALLGLSEDPGAPLIGMVSRLVEAKGFDLVKKVIPGLLEERDMQLVLLGTGIEEYEEFFKQLAADYPKKAAVELKFSPSMASKIYAGSDLFLMPSKSEPCGLAQMLALRYGSIPIVHKIGGLKDTVTDVSEPGGNGFTFESPDAKAMKSAIKRALDAMGDKKSWRRLVNRAMECDNSWNNSADKYINELYEGLLETKP